MNRSLISYAGMGGKKKKSPQHGSKPLDKIGTNRILSMHKVTLSKAENISFIQADSTHLENVEARNGIDKIRLSRSGFSFWPGEKNALLNSAFHVLKSWWNV